MGLTVGVNGLTERFNSDEDFDGPRISKTEYNPGINILFGHNLHRNNFLYGWEIDIGTAGSRTKLRPEDGVGSPCTSKIEFLGHAKARFGYMIGDFLPYFNLGFSAGRFTHKFPEDSLISTDTSAGTTIGLGLEYALTEKFNLRAEWNLDKLSTISLSSGGDSLYVNPKVNSFKVGVSYKL